MLVRDSEGHLDEPDLAVGQNVMGRVRGIEGPAAVLIEHKAGRRLAVDREAQRRAIILVERDQSAGGGLALDRLRPMGGSDGRIISAGYRNGERGNRSLALVIRDHIIDGDIAALALGE